MLPTVTPRADITTDPRERGADSPHRVLAVTRARPRAASFRARSRVSSFGLLTLMCHIQMPPASDSAAPAHPLTSQLEGSAREVVSTGGEMARRDTPSK